MRTDEFPKPSMFPMAGMSPMSHTPHVAPHGKRFQRAANRDTRSIEYVCVDHRGAHVLVPEQFLDRPNVGAAG
jgi:hypothetical protein